MIDLPPNYTAIQSAELAMLYGWHPKDVARLKSL